MWMTAATELGPDQWFPSIMKNLTGIEGVLFLVYTAGLMFVLRFFFGGLAHRLGLTAEPFTPSEESVFTSRVGLESFLPVSWETAIDIVAGQFLETVKTHGPDAVAGLASARCTNEDNYLFQKLMRVGIGTNNIDSCNRT